MEFRFEEKEIPVMYNRISLQFEGIDIPIKEVDMKKDADGVRTIFRQANTQFKKALQYFVLDGHVTEHIQILEHQSELYKQLSLLETEPKKLAGLFERRLDLLEPVYKEINPKAYQATWEKLMVEMAQIYNELQEIKFLELFGDNAKPATAKNIQKLNVYCEQVIKLYTDIEKILIDDKETERDFQYFNSIVTAKFNVARSYSRVYRQDREGRVSNLVNSLNKYKDIASYIEKSIPEELKKKHYEFEQQHNMSVEMVNLLPSKIDKANAMM